MTSLKRPRSRRRLASLRLRLGIALWLLSWVPFPVILGISGTARLVIWGVQFAVGAVGLALAGSAFLEAARQVGWKRAPAVLWQALLQGETG